MALTIPSLWDILPKNQISADSDILRVSKNRQNSRYVMAISSFSGFQMFEYVGETTGFGTAIIFVFNSRYL